MAPKKASTTGAAALQPLDPNQETLSLREARSQKRKAVSPTLQEDELDQEIRDMENTYDDSWYRNQCHIFII
jgi:hypothetical protein